MIFCILSGYTEVMPIVPECITRWSKVHYEQVRYTIQVTKWDKNLYHKIYRLVILRSFKVRLVLGFRKTPKPYELYNRYHQEFHAPHCDRGHGQERVCADALDVGLTNGGPNSDRTLDVIHKFKLLQLLPRNH